MVPSLMFRYEMRDEKGVGMVMMMAAVGRGVDGS